MVDRYLSLKLGVNPLDGFQESYVYGRTDGRTTATDAHVMTYLCCAVTQRSYGPHYRLFKMFYNSVF